MAFVAAALPALGSALSSPAVVGGLGLAGAATSAVGTIASGQAASENAAYQAQVATMNQQIANQNAARAVEAGQQQAYVTSQKAAQEVGKVETGFAANDIDVHTGSAAKVEEGAREEGELSAETALSNAQLQAYGYHAQAAGFQAQSGLERTEAAQAPIGADIGAAGGFLGNASSIGFKWLNPNWGQTGASGSAP